MAIHAESSDLSATAVEFRATFDALGLAHGHVAKLFGVGPRSIRRWRDGNRRVPCGVGIVLRLLATGTVTVAQLEQAAAEPELRALLPIAPAPESSALAPPAPEQPVLAPTEAATLAAPSLST